MRAWTTADLLMDDLYHISNTASSRSKLCREATPPKANRIDDMPSDLAVPPSGVSLPAMEDLRTDAIIKAMTPEQRLTASMKLYWSARQLRAAGIRAANPDWSEEKVQQEVRHAFLFARS